jgi:hypothetical protein
MLGGMEEVPEVGDLPLAKLVGLDFGLPSSEDTVSCMLHQLLLLALLFFGFNNLVSFHASVLYFSLLVTVREGAE